MVPPIPYHFRDVGPAGIDVIRPLWEELRRHHAALPDWPFAAEMADFDFGPRREELLAKSRDGGRLLVDLAGTSEGDDPVAYCVTSLKPGGEGVIDSLFVEADHRGRGVGATLVRRAIDWLDAGGAESKSVGVAYANDDALRLYRRFGFHPRLIVLRQPRRS